MPLRLIEGQYAPGDPICADLATSDRSGSQAFYSEVFDWHFEEIEGRTQAMKGRRMAAGLGLMEGLDLADGRWWLCLAAPDLTGLTDQVPPGGSISRPIEIRGLGRAAVLEDPSGAKAVLWQPDKLEPGALGSTHGGLVWSDLIVDDPSQVAPFYGELFDVEVVPVEDPSTPNTFNLQRRELEVPRMVAGIIPSAHASPRTDTGARWRPYFQVDHLETVLKVAERAGGRSSTTGMSASGRRIAILTDPQGAEFGVVEAARSS
jgi:predicted enzyme related to lactoylglutathione lyase